MQLNSHYLGFFLLHEAIDPCNKIVSEFLNLLFGILYIVFGNTFYFLQGFVRVFSDSTYTYFSVFALITYLFHQLLSAFFGKHWNINNYLLAIVLWIETKVSIADCFFN